MKHTQRPQNQQYALLFHNPFPLFFLLPAWRVLLLTKPCLIASVQTVKPHCRCDFNIQHEHNVSQGSTILFCLIPCHYFSVQNDHWLSECYVSHSTLRCKQEQCVFSSTSQLCHFPSIFGEIHPKSVRWLIYLNNFSNFPEKCSEILLKITWKLKPLYWALQTGQRGCQDYCFYSGS